MASARLTEPGRTGGASICAEWREETESLCPECLWKIPASIYRQSGRVWIEKRCARHGESRALLASDADEYLKLRKFVPPRVTGICCGAGESCDPEAPPVCVLLLEITQACNLRCPTCYADAHGHDFMTVEVARKRLDAFFRFQQRLDVLMLSGGEPTIHPRFREILDLALEYPIGRVLVNTNGLRLNQDDGLAAQLEARRDRVELYFSMGGFRKETHLRLYGVDLRRQKRGALEVAQKAGVFTTLVQAVEHGVNEDEVGEIFRYGLSLDHVAGISYQPVMSAGRYHHEYRPEDRMTLTDVLTALETQTEGALLRSDFVGLPCSHPDCCALTYGFLDAGRTRIMPLPRHLDVARYLDLFADRISFAGLIGGAARRAWSDVVHFRGGQTLRDLAVLFARGGVRDVIPLMRDPRAFGRRVFRVVIKPFMDAHTYDHRRVQQCCTKILDENGEAVSFCEYNVLRRGRKERQVGIPLMPRSEVTK